MSPAENIVLEEIRKIVPHAEPSALLDELPLDSLEFLDLLVQLEKRFDIVIHNDALQQFDSVHDLIVAFAR